MPMEREFLQMMVDTVQWERFEKRDAYGKPTYRSPEPLRCRLVQKTELVADSEGQERVAMGHIYLFGAPGITVQDRFTLPDGSQPVVLRVGRFPDNTGPHHEVIWYG